MLAREPGTACARRPRRRSRRDVTALPRSGLRSFPEPPPSTCQYPAPAHQRSASAPVVLLERLKPHDLLGPHRPVLGSPALIGLHRHLQVPTHSVESDPQPTADQPPAASSPPAPTNAPSPSSKATSSPCSGDRDSHNGCKPAGSRRLRDLDDAQDRSRSAHLVSGRIRPKRQRDWKRRLKAWGPTRDSSHSAASLDRWLFVQSRASASLAIKAFPACKSRDAFDLSVLDGKGE